MKQELKEPANYNAIVEAIAQGATKLNEISNKVQMENSNVSACLKSLISLGLVEKESAITEEDNKKKTGYILADHMFRFWYRYVPKCMLLINTRRPERAYEKLLFPICRIIWERYLRKCVCNMLLCLTLRKNFLMIY